MIESVRLSVNLIKKGFTASGETNDIHWNRILMTGSIYVVLRNNISRKQTPPPFFYLLNLFSKKNLGQKYNLAKT